MTVSEPRGGVTQKGAESASDDSEALPPGSKVGEYRIDRLIGEGGFGAVYRATHPLIGKTAAIKVIKQEYSGHPEMVSRFVAEARAVNAIGHRNIIDIFGFGRLPDGRHYYVMELCDGETLEAHIHARGPLAVADALEILRPLARALDAAHSHGIAHRDLKPENIFLANVGEPKPLVKLLDFGIAKLTGGLGAQHKTEAGMPMGTPAYMSPEQVNGAVVDARTDVYSFGIVAFEVLTASLPFLGESALDVMVKQAGVPPPPLSAMRPELAPLDHAVLHMMAKEPTARPDSAILAVDALTEAAVRAGMVDRRQFPPLAAERPLEAQVPVVEAEPVLVGVIERRSRWLLPAALLLSGAIGIVAFLALRSSPAAAPKASSPAAPAALSVLAAPIESPSSSSVTAALPSQPSSEIVQVSLALEPKDAEAYLGSTRIKANPFSLPRGSEPVTIELRKSGHITEKVALIPDRDRELTVTLKKQTQRSKEYGTWD